MIQKITASRLPTEFGEFSLYLFKENITEKEHLAMVRGEIDPNDPVTVRIHSECLTGEVFGSTRCDCKWQLEHSLETIAKIGQGIVIYLRQEGRGIGLEGKLKAYNLQDDGLNTVEANVKLGFGVDQRQYDIPAAILKYFKVKTVKLITNNPNKISELESFGINVCEVLKSQAPITKENADYLETKQKKMGHLLSTDD